MLQPFDLSCKAWLGRVIIITVGDSECPVHLIHQHCNSISERWSEDDMKTSTENMASLLRVRKWPSWKAAWSLWQTVCRGRLQPDRSLRGNTDTQRGPANSNKINMMKSKPLLSLRYRKTNNFFRCGDCLKVYIHGLLMLHWRQSFFVV